jgi:hypothetical protein
MLRQLLTGCRGAATLRRLASPAPDRPLAVPPALARAAPVRLAAAALIVGALAAPWIWHRFDVERCFLGWARATEGRLPWAVYEAGARGLAPVDCDYPPVVPYLLAAVEGARLFLGAESPGRLTVALLKTPGLLFWAAAVLLAFRWVRRSQGEQAGRLVAALTAASLPVFVNAAVWGQFDGMVALLLMLAVAALLDGRPRVAGALLGLGLATKLLLVAAVPVMAVWTLRKEGGRRLASMLATAALVMLLLALPHALGGGIHGVSAAYVEAVGYYPRRTMEAYNPWYLLDRLETRMGALAPAEVRLDTRPVAGPLTSRHVGLALFGAYLLYVCAGVWRRPRPDVLALGVGLSLFGFFMLPTQIHGRYLVAAVPVLALAAARSRVAWLLFLGLSVTASLGQLIELGRSMLEHSHRLDPSAWADIRGSRGLVRTAAVVTALLNLGLFGWATVAFRREGAPDQNS